MSVTDLEGILQELTSDDLSENAAHTKIREGCGIVSNIKAGGVTIPTSTGVTAIDDCSSNAMCSWVLRVLISSHNAQYLIKVGTCTRKAQTDMLVSSLVSSLRNTFFPSNEVSEQDQALERKCIFIVLEKIVKFRSFSKSIADDVRRTLLSSMDMETNSGDNDEARHNALDAALKAWDGIGNDESVVPDFKVEPGPGEDKKKAQDTIPDYTDGAPTADEGLVTAMPVDSVELAPLSTALGTMVKPQDKMPFHKTRKFKIFAALSFLCAVVLAIGVTLGVLRPWEDPVGTTDPTASPTGTPTNERDMVFTSSIFEPQEDEDQVVHTRALNWLKNEDPLQLSNDDDNIERRLALATLYFSTGGDEWTNCSSTAESACNDDGVERFLSGTDECNWYGVECENGVLSSIDLSYNYLNGTLPQRISSFKALNSLYMMGNFLRGTIPESIGELSDITELQMGENYFTGSLPASLYEIQSLEVIAFYQNELNGTIPDSIGELRNLKGFWMFDNQLSGTIPENIGNLNFLTYINVSNNKLTGNIPSSIWKLRSLETFDIGVNEFSPWTFPENIAFKSIDRFGVKATNLKGTLPDYFYEFDKMSIFLSEKNVLEGEISSKIGNLRSLQSFDVGYNTLNGTIPAEFSELDELENLILRGNEFTGTIPASFNDMAIVRLFLHYNKGLTGEIIGPTCNNTYIIITDCLDTFNDPLVICDCCFYCCDAEQQSCVEES